MNESCHTHESGVGCECARRAVAAMSARCFHVRISHVTRVKMVLGMNTRREQLQKCEQGAPTWISDMSELQLVLQCVAVCCSLLQCVAV